MYRKAALRLALAFGLAITVSGVAHAGAPAGAAAPTCNPGTACYVQWTERSGVTRTESNPDTYYCYQLYYDGAIAGFNGTDKRIYLYKDRDCQGGARAYVDPRVGWQDSTNVYYSFDFVP
ncbi:hypothetical protein [Streptomyces flavofungini]|uniref:Peptidase inhibitor family I36 n=1 Tax=Streptomyces flavofungini TaxID=68200 RepID=A0ABS0XEM1_9ACTN|nr:hypothetical protein [Streptomyces flavofungini]MBJ3811640.1 hypothetical protein [Streptomyces flavofungini]